MKYFYEQMTGIGKWSPRTSDERPSEKRSDGSKQKIRNVREIQPEHQGKSLDELAAIFAPFEPTHIHVATGEGFTLLLGHAVLVDGANPEALVVLIDQDGNKFGFRKSEFDRLFREV